MNFADFLMASFVYVSYATLVGLTFSTLFMVYTASSISSAFFVTGFSFAGLSVFGYTTKKDLGPIASFCMMGLFGMIGMMILGFFIPSMVKRYGDELQRSQGVPVQIRVGLNSGEVVVRSVGSDLRMVCASRR